MASIDSQPDNNNNDDDDATFTFSGTDATSGVASFECSFDGGDYAACTSGDNMGTDLADGTHTFDVRAIDTAGNTGAADSYSWTVDDTAPSAAITSDVTWDTDGTVTVTFTASDATSGIASCTLTISDGQTHDCSGGDGSADFSMSDGSGYTASISISDNAGNSASSNTDTFGVDTTSPSASIDSNPAHPSDSTTATFEFSGSDATSGVASIECSLNDAAYGACTSPFSQANMGDGEHTFAVRAIDTAGNTGSSDSYTWYIDLADPVATVTGQSGADDPDNSQSATFTYTVEDAAGFGVTAQCARDGNAADDYGACSVSSTHCVSD